MGKGEEHIGQMIKGIARDRLVIITKFGCLRQHNPLNESCAAQVEKSLRALKTEYIDVLLIHGLSVDDARFLRDDAIRSALADLKRSGKIRFCGASVHGDPTEILSIMLEDRFFDVAMIPFSYYTGRGIIDALGRARRSGIGIITMKSYLLTRRIRKTRLEPLVLRYILSRPFVDTTALRIDYVETLERYLSALRAPYSRSDAEALLGLVEGIGPFCRGCYECVSQCRAGLPIPDAVRCLAYLDEYEDVAMASECYATLFPRDEASACLDCGPCAVRCRAGLSVRDLAQRAHLLFGPASSRRETSA
jgi:predicted aldo/keto reductase-like oxidoreductase